MNKIIIKKLKFSSNYIYNEHNHNYYEINYIDSGRCIMNINEEKVALRKGDCIIIPPMLKHNFIVDCIDGCTIKQFIKLSKIENDFKNLEIFNLNYFYKVNSSYDICEVLKNLIKYKENEQDYYNKILLDLEENKLYILLSLYIKNNYYLNTDYENDILNKILFYINNKYDEDINLEDLATKYHISSRYMRKIFKNKIGFSAIDYITSLRIEKAKKLLRYSKKSISDISIEVGYNSVQYFSKIFKNKIGLSPKDFRKQY